MQLAPIKTQRHYRRILKEIEGLMNAKRNTPKGDRLHLLVMLVEAWEAKHYSLDLPDAVEGIKQPHGSARSYPSRSGSLH